VRHAHKVPYSSYLLSFRNVLHACIISIFSKGLVVIGNLKNSGKGLSRRLKPRGRRRLSISSLFQTSLERERATYARARDPKCPYLSISRSSQYITLARWSLAGHWGGPVNASSRPGSAIVSDGRHRVRSSLPHPKRLRWNGTN
jgi:hypothetical protein